MAPNRDIIQLYSLTRFIILQRQVVFVQLRIIKAVWV